LGLMRCSKSSFIRINSGFCAALRPTDAFSLQIVNSFSERDVQKTAGFATCRLHFFSPESQFGFSLVCGS